MATVPPLSPYHRAPTPTLTFLTEIETKCWQNNRQELMCFPSCSGKCKISTGDPSRKGPCGQAVQLSLSHVSPHELKDLVLVGSVVDMSDDDPESTLPNVVHLRVFKTPKDTTDNGWIVGQVSESSTERSNEMMITFDPQGFWHVLHESQGRKRKKIRNTKRYGQFQVMMYRIFYDPISGKKRHYERISSTSSPMFTIQSGKTHERQWGRQQKILATRERVQATWQTRGRRHGHERPVMTILTRVKKWYWRNHRKNVLQFPGPDRSVDVQLDIPARDRERMTTDHWRCFGKLCTPGEELMFLDAPSPCSIRYSEEWTKGQIVPRNSTTSEGTTRMVVKFSHETKAKPWKLSEQEGIDAKRPPLERLYGYFQVHLVNEHQEIMSVVGSDFFYIRSDKTRTREQQRQQKFNTTRVDESFGEEHSSRVHKSPRFGDTAMNGPSPYLGHEEQHYTPTPSPRNGQFDFPPEDFTEDELKTLTQLFWTKSL